MYEETFCGKRRRAKGEGQVEALAEPPSGWPSEADWEADPVAAGTTAWALVQAQKAENRRIEARTRRLEAQATELRAQIEAHEVAIIDGAFRRILRGVRRRPVMVRAARARAPRSRRATCTAASRDGPHRDPDDDPPALAPLAPLVAAELQAALARWVAQR